MTSSEFGSEVKMMTATTKAIVIFWFCPCLNVVLMSPHLVVFQGSYVAVSGTPGRGSVHVVDHVPALGRESVTVVNGVRVRGRAGHNTALVPVAPPPVVHPVLSETPVVQTPAVAPVPVVPAQVAPSQPAPSKEETFYNLRLEV